MCTSPCEVTWTNKAGKDRIAFKHITWKIQRFVIWNELYSFLKSDKFPVKQLRLLLTGSAGKALEQSGQEDTWAALHRASPGVLRWSTCLDPLTGRAAAAGGSGPLESLRQATITARKVGGSATAEGRFRGGGGVLQPSCCEFKERSPTAVALEAGGGDLSPHGNLISLKNVNFNFYYDMSYIFSFRRKLSFSTNGCNKYNIYTLQTSAIW